LNSKTSNAKALAPAQLPPQAVRVLSRLSALVLMAPEAVEVLVVEARASREVVPSSQVHLNEGRQTGLPSFFAKKVP
jgi:hypothetical protein